MYQLTTTFKLLISFALTLLTQVAFAQSEFSFEQARTPSEATSNQLRFNQLPEFTVPQEGAEELIGRVAERPFVIPPVPMELLNARTARTARKRAARTTAVVAERNSLPAVSHRSPTPQIAPEQKQIAPKQKQIAPEQKQIASDDDEAWQGNPFINSGVIKAGGVVTTQPGFNYFTDRSAVTIDQSGWNLPMPALVKASATEPVAPASTAQDTGLSLTEPKTLNLNSAEPIAKMAKAAAPKTTSKVTEPSAAMSEASATKEPATKPKKPPAKKSTKAKTPAKTPAKAKDPAKKDDAKLPHVLLGAKNFKLAAQPAHGAHFREDSPLTDPRAHKIEPLHDDFSPGPAYDSLPYVPHEQQGVYTGKKLYSNQRPLVELGRPWYQLGQLSEGYTWFGNHNTITPQFLIYGDFRSAIASNNVGGNGTTLTASELNLDIDLKLTGTERFHAFVSPLDNGVQNSGYNFDDDEFVSQFDANVDFGYFEGDLGAMVGGITGETLPFDFPFAIGVMPLLIQNGVWFEDAFLGIAATLPARNSARFDISNMDITFFAGYDKISSDAFAGDDSAARMYGVASFIEAANGYFEVDYAFLDDRTTDNRSYHNIGFAYSRRYGRLISNSTRIIVNAGQSSNAVENTADGVLLLSENSLITGAPSTVVPYFNFFAGFDRPQSAARAAQAGGVLRNTGILFESDGMTGYPTLDPTANDTYGAALGLNLLADDFSQQLLVEVAALGVMGDDSNRNAPGGQVGVGFRYQLPLSNSLILRTDGMYGFLENADNIHGVRMELRRKW